MHLNDEWFSLLYRRYYLAIEIGSNCRVYEILRVKFQLKSYNIFFLDTNKRNRSVAV